LSLVKSRNGAASLGGPFFVEVAQSPKLISPACKFNIASMQVQYRQHDGDTSTDIMLLGPTLSLPLNTSGTLPDMLEGL